MGKRIIIKGADFSENGIHLPNSLTDKDCTIEKCGVYALTGELTNDPETYSAWNTSDFIDISGFTKLTFVKCGTAVNFGVAFYDESKQYISGVIYASQTGTTISIPSSAKYLRFSDYSEWDVELALN